MHYYEIARSFVEIGGKSEFLRILGNFVAYFITTAQLFPIFRKLLVIIPSIKNHPQLIILNQKISSNTKSPMLLTQLLL